jgi:hypothetical protein
MMRRVEKLRWALIEQLYDYIDSDDNIDDDNIDSEM